MLAVIFGIAGGKLAAPIDGQAQRLHLAAHDIDILIGPITRMPAIFHGGILGGHTKSVPPHRVQDIMACACLIAGNHVSHGVIADMPDMDTARWIGEHLQHVIFRAAFIAFGEEDFSIIPCFLPFRLDGAWLIAGHINSSRVVW